MKRRKTKTPTKTCWSAFRLFMSRCSSPEAGRSRNDRCSNHTSQRWPPAIRISVTLSSVTFHHGESWWGWIGHKKNPGDYAQASVAGKGRVRQAGPALVNRAPRGSRPDGFDPRAHIELLAGGTRAKGPPLCGVAITARRAGALLTGLATA